VRLIVVLARLGGEFESLVPEGVGCHDADAVLHEVLHALALQPVEGSHHKRHLQPLDWHRHEHEAGHDLRVQETVDAQDGHRECVRVQGLVHREANSGYEGHHLEDLPPLADVVARGPRKVGVEFKVLCR